MLRVAMFMHCTGVWLNNCIAKGNYVSFLGVVFTGLLIIILELATITYIVIDPNTGSGTSSAIDTVIPNEAVFWVLLGVPCGKKASAVPFLYGEVLACVFVD